MMPRELSSLLPAKARQLLSMIPFGSRSTTAPPENTSATVGMLMLDWPLKSKHVSRMPLGGAGGYCLIPALNADDSAE